MQRETKRKIGIRRKILLIIFLIGGSLIAIGLGLGYYSGGNLLRKTIGFERHEIAKRISSTVGGEIEGRVSILRGISLRYVWIEAVEKKNLEYDLMDKQGLKQYFKDMDRKWADAPPGSLILKEYLENTSSGMARELIREDSYVSEIFITDKLGGLIASSGKTSDFYQADEEWWQKAYNDGKGAVYIGSVEEDASSGTRAIPFAIPLKAGDGSVVGVCKAIVKTEAFFAPLDRVRIGKTGSAFLVDNKGIIIFYHGITEYQDQRIFSESDFKKLTESERRWKIISSTGLYPGERLFVSMAKVSDPLLLKNKINWFVVISSDVKEIFQPLDTLVNQGLFLAALLIAVMILLGFIFSTGFVRPIKKIYEATKHIAGGDLDYQIEIKTGDEIEGLADSFSNMVSSIKENQKKILAEKVYTEGIISSMVDTLIVTDFDGRIKTVNKATCDLLGYKEEELIGKDISPLFTEEKENSLFKGKGFRDLIRKGSVENLDMTYETKGGEKIPVSFSGSAMRDKDGQLIGVVGVARDMRQTLTLISDLKKSNTALEELSRTLEEKVGNRTKNLEESQEATLNIMEDMQESKEKLQRSVIELAKAKTEVESFSKGLEDKMKERTLELSILYEVSNAISYTLDYQTLLKLIMESLFKIVDYDICASLLFDSRTVNITIKPAYAESAGFIDEVKNSLIDSTSTLTGESIRKKHMSAFLIPTAPDAKPKEDRSFDEMRSFFNVPFVVRGKTIGMINVSSCKESAFSEDDVKLIYTIANQASNAIERLQAVITAEKSKMESMVESMTEGVIMIDERGEIAVLNPRARLMLGFGIDEEVATKVVNDKIKALNLDKALAECQDKKQLVTKEITISQDGDQILHCDISPVKDAEGDVIGIVTILRDITKEKEIDIMKTEFISTVSHELRTPLTTMKEFVSIISDEIPGKLTKDQKEYVDIIISNIDRLARLINDLLDISKIEAGKTELKKKLVDIAKLAEGVISTIKSQTDEKHIELKAAFHTPLPGVYGDADKIIQIFTNLIGNATKFTPEKGQISVEIKNMESEVECSVSDTGKGISTEDIERLFSKFQQFGRVAGSGAKGTGLGLAISKELVEMHHGKLWAESKIGKGSKFIFTLPKYTAGSLFKEPISNAIKSAIKGDYKMSLVVVSLLNFDKLKEELTSKNTDSILKDMEDVLNDSLRRKEGDTAFKGISEVAVVLADCNRENALSVEGRLENALENYLISKDLSKKIKLHFGCATYPDEAKNIEELIKKAKEV